MRLSEISAVNDVGDRHQGKRSDLRRLGRMHLVLLLSLVAAVGYYVWLPRYYRAVLDEADRMTVVVYCDTMALDESVRAFAYYDALALAPLCRALGMFQNRAPERVRKFHPVRVPVAARNAYSIEIGDVPKGPLARLAFHDEQKTFHVDVADRVPYKGKLSIHLKDGL
jgi:hypothetical protein